MKAIKFLGQLFCMLSFVTLGLVSCSDDDGGYSSSIVGAWQSEIHSSRIWIFMENGYVLSSDDEYGTYQVNGSRLDINWTDEDGDNYEESFLIVELTSNTMTLDELDDEGVAHDDPETYYKIDK